METKAPKNRIDWYLFISIIALMLFSLAVVYTASSTISELKTGSTETLFLSHLGKIAIGILAMIVVSGIDYNIYKKFTKPAMIIGIILLIIVLVGGSSAKGASRWINLGGVSIQPSEFAKFAMIFHFAAMLEKKQEFIKDFETGFVPFIVWTLVICILIALQPNFSTMIVIFMISFAMMFIGNVNLLYLIYTGIIGVVLAGVYAVSAPYRLARIQTYLGGEDAGGEAVSYQLKQALIAIGNGGVSGVGVGQSRQSHMFLPESYGDFIFSIIGEEFGFIGLFFVIAIFGFIFYRGMLIARKAPNAFGYFLSVGIVVTFSIYVFVNAGVNTGLLPTTGLPLPFISFGGTAIIIYSIAIGVLLNISKQAGVYNHENSILD
ncbi:MAG: putative lipid II flippase FtsW [Ignavibacteriae bacterium]|nr:putative lipid II flippase FtsW [Ignavibacteriota bacterium]